VKPSPPPRRVWDFVNTSCPTNSCVRTRLPSPASWRSVSSRRSACGRSLVCALRCARPRGFRRRDAAADLGGKHSAELRGAVESQGLGEERPTTELAPPAGLEPATRCLEGIRSFLNRNRGNSHLVGDCSRQQADAQQSHRLGQLPRTEGPRLPALVYSGPVCALRQWTSSHWRPDEFGRSTDYPRLHDCAFRSPLPQTEGRGVSL